MLSNLNQNIEDYIEEVAFAILGAQQTGKTSLANALFGYNEDKDDDAKQALHLFVVNKDNDFGYKNGHILGKQDR